MIEDDFKDDPNYAIFVTPTFELFEGDEVPASKIPDIDDGQDENGIDTYDQYVLAQVRVPVGDEIRTGNVMRCKRELYGTLKGRANATSILDTRTYHIEFPDGCSDEYTANIIAENM
jgi:hypothetical protein